MSHPVIKFKRQAKFFEFFFTLLNDRLMNRVDVSDPTLKMLGFEGKLQEQLYPGWVAYLNQSPGFVPANAMGIGHFNNLVELAVRELFNGF